MSERRGTRAKKMLLTGVTRGLLLLTIALAVSANNQSQFVQSQEQQLVAPSEQRNHLNYNDLRSGPGNGQSLKSNSTSETLETAPSITSVHQVWTSSSSGRLDELSPEIISKLRNDVPFLAAYALRPRLVGASAAPLIAHLQAAAPEASAGAARLDVAASSTGDPKVALASSARQLDGRTLSKLGDFSEYNEETSSLSKSEHSHRRKTSVRRARDEDGPLEFSSSSLRRRRVSASSGRSDDKGGDSLKQLVNRLKQRSSGGKSRTSNTNGLKKSASRSKRTGKQANSRRGGSKSSRARKATKISRVRTTKRRASKSGRLLQEDSQSKVNDERATGGAGDVKGGGPAGAAKKPPFYASTRPDVKEERTTTESPSNSIDENNKLDNSGSQPEDGAEIDEEPREVEPKRVGDDDVEEDIGDTVLVEPKSDGIDDDPPLPDSLPDDDDDDDVDGQEEDTQDGKKAGGESPGGDKADGDVGTRTRGSDSGVATPMPRLAPEGDSRGNRVNRHKPNQPPVDNIDSTSDDDNSSGDTGGSSGGGGSQVAGGGIGTTLGGGGGSSGAGDDSDDNQSGADGGSSSRGGSAGVTPGVEFAAGDREDDERDARGGRGETGAGGDATGAGSSGDGQFGDRRQGSQDGAGGSNSGRGGSGGKDEGEDDDLDYRDEMAEAERKSTGDKVPTSGSGDGTRDGHNNNNNNKSGGGGGSKSTSDDEGADHKGAKGSRPATGGGGDHATGHEHGQHCDDGSYNHDHDGHGGHHSHHDTIDWLRGAIPGEPDDDYPILSRVNATKFKCADQKHPGYYADVDARCQIFHICQADGRQDSFLCPNGTIFSQRTLVCVWWNGFQCEDPSAHSAVCQLGGSSHKETQVHAPKSSERVTIAMIQQSDSTTTLRTMKAHIACLLLASVLQACASQASLVEEEFALITTQLHYPLIATDDNQIETHHTAAAILASDAPKYYHLNELLYKTTNGNESPQAAALPSASSMAGRGAFMRPLMTPLRPNGMRTSEDRNDENDDRMAAALVPGDDDGDDTSPIDGLVRAMRGRGGESATARDATGNAIGGGPADRAVSREQEEERAAGGRVSPRGHSNAAPGRRILDDGADEATIQRKSTNLDDDDADADEPPARLRARDNIRRRRRRASTRQAPPKLKSRRVSRNSRRRKLRHGVKPRRRA